MKYSVNIFKSLDGEKENLGAPLNWAAARSRITETNNYLRASSPQRLFALRRLATRKRGKRKSHK